MDGRRKNSSSISQVFSIPWFSKLKQLSKKNKSQSSKSSRKTKSIYDDSESYWQISFGGCSPQGKTDTDDVAAQEDDQNFTDMVGSLRNTRGLGRENGGGTPVQTPGRRIKKGRKPGKTESAEFSQRPSYDTFDWELMEAIKQLEKEYECSRNARQADLGIKSAKAGKTNTLLLKSEKQRKSVYVNREGQKSRAKQSCKVKVHSPRTPPKAEICKIKALEDIKKERAKKKDEPIVKGAGLERFAVTKCTFDPQKDFRDSMIEMILEEGIRKPEELENLLACYLTLNSDEYHDFIVSAFRQVWLMYINLVNV